MTFVCVDWGFFKLVWGPYEEVEKNIKRTTRQASLRTLIKKKKKKGSRTYVKVKNKSR